MARRCPALPVDCYLVDVLLRDLVGHDKRPAAFLVYLHFYALSERNGWMPISASLRNVSEETGLSKSAAQAAVAVLRRRKLINTRSASATAVSVHRVNRPWRE